MAELVDVPGLGPGELARGGSSPSIRTLKSCNLGFKGKCIITKYTFVCIKICS